MANQASISLLERRRNRALAAILGVKEREVDRYLPPEVAARLRKAILDQVNDYHQTVLDILDSVADPETVVVNEIWLERLDEIHGNMERLVAVLEGG